MMHRLLKFLGLFLLLCTVSTPSLSGKPDNGIGINLAPVRNYNPSFPFLDLFKAAGGWVTQRDNIKKWNTKEPLDLDEFGWVKSIAPGQIVVTIFASYKNGTHHVVYDGQGMLQMKGGARKQKKVDEGHYTFELQKSKSIQVHLRATDPDDYIRNIRVFHDDDKDTYEKNVFNPKYLDYLKPFTMIRYSNWVGNRDPRPVIMEDLTWDERTKPQTAFQGRVRGVALEHIIDMSNRLNVQPWLPIPHRADDDYVRKFALYVKNNLNPDLKFYLEYSNEVWNRIFVQHKYLIQKARDDNLKDWHAAYIKRSIEIFKIFEEVFGSHERFTRTIGGHFWNLGRNKEFMKQRGVEENFDALAIAPYIGGATGKDGSLSMTDVDKVFQDLDAYMIRYRKHMKNTKKAAAKYGLQVIAYEGGQHVTAAIDPKKGKKQYLCKAVNHVPRMGEVYKEYLRAWYDEFPDSPFFLFNDVQHDGRSGCWGLVTQIYPELDGRIKYDAVLSFMKEAGFR